MKGKLKALLKKNSGFTLVEILVAIFIFAFVIGSVMSVFVTSAKTQKSSESVTRAEAAAQKYIEKLNGQNYTAVLAKQGSKVQDTGSGYYISFSLKPQGSGGTAAYVHVIYTGSGVFVVGPDGKKTTTRTAINTVTITSDTTTYRVIADSDTISGTIPSGYKIAVVVNAMKKTTTTGPTVNGNSLMSAVVFGTKDNAAGVSFNFSNIVRYADTAKADTSLVQVQADVYLKSSDTEKAATIESMLQLKNA
jgi:prepilin-type N-terminal cleavage/methylation domain-containing protein